jgi:Uncharacterized conserved protein
MIFITLGSQKFQFNRLLKAVDEQAADGRIKDRLFAQIGASDYYPKNYDYKDFLDRNEFRDQMSRADIVITHGGTGAIISAVKQGKKVIAVPRLAKFGEHVDDHQLQLIEQFRELNLICECHDCDEIWKSVEKVKNIEYNGYESNTNRIIEDIEEFVRKGLRD